MITANTKKPSKLKTAKKLKKIHPSYVSSKINSFLSVSVFCSLFFDFFYFVNISYRQDLWRIRISFTDIYIYIKIKSLAVNIISLVSYQAAFFYSPKLLVPGNILLLSLFFVSKLFCSKFSIIELSFTDDSQMFAWISQIPQWSAEIDH